MACVGALDRLRAVVAEHLGEPHGRGQVGRVLGQKVAAHLVRHAHVAKHDAQDVLVDLALAHEAHRQDAQSLLETLGDAVHLLRARRRAAHVDLVRRAATKPTRRVSSRNTGMIS